MLGWIWRVIVGHFDRCEHKWEIISEMETQSRERPGVTAGQIYGLRCEKCGDITQRYVGIR